MRDSIRPMIVVMLLLSPTANAQVGAQGDFNKSLRGIKNVAVVIEDVNTFTWAVGTEPDTPAQAKVKAGVEEQLRGAGIQVSGVEDRGRRGAAPTLHLRLLAQKDAAGFNYYALRLWLTEEVTLARARPVRVVATTWDYSMAGSGMGSQLFEREICEGVNVFVTAYKAANSAKTAPGQPMLFPPDQYSGPCPLVKQQ